jgi:NAD(P)H-dependent FMN reductase
VTTKPRIAIVIGSTRPGRYADKAAGWMLKQTQARNDIEAELVDLRDHPKGFIKTLTALDRPPRWGHFFGSGDGGTSVRPR